MNKNHRWIAFTLVFALTTSSIYGQDSCYAEEVPCTAYIQGTHTAHWSVYIPIAILVGVAIWFGLADRKESRHDSYDSQDGLGSIASPKRIHPQNLARSKMDLCPFSRGNHAH